jgi:hypothetical protein
MSKPLAGSIAAAGVANALIFPLGDASTTLALLEISGQYASAQLVFEGLPIGSQNWFPIAGVQQDTQAVVNGYATNPYIVTPDGATLGFKFDTSLLNSIRVWCAALNTGPLNAVWNSGSFFFSPPGGSAAAAGGQSIAAATLWQLMELTRIAAAGAGLTAKPNPVLPGGLPASIWNDF